MNNVYVKAMKQETKEFFSGEERTTIIDSRVSIHVGTDQDPKDCIVIKDICMKYINQFISDLDYLAKSNSYDPVKLYIGFNKITIRRLDKPINEVDMYEFTQLRSVDPKTSKTYTEYVSRNFLFDLLYDLKEAINYAGWSNHD